MTAASVRRPVLLALLIPALGAAAEPGPAAKPPAGVAEDYPVPKGIPEDQALWEKLVATQNAVTISRAQALQHLRQQDEARYDLRLAELARRSPGQVASRAEGLRARLLEAWNAVHQLLTRPWPVDPRLGCRAERLDLEVAMGAPDAFELERSRAAARPCLEKMAGAVARMEEANRALATVVVEVQTAVPSAGAASPAVPNPGAAPPAPPPPRATP